MEYPICSFNGRHSCICLIYANAAVVPAIGVSNGGRRGVYDVCNRFLGRSDGDEAYHKVSDTVFSCFYIDRKWISAQLFLAILGRNSIYIPMDCWDYKCV